MTKRMPGKTLDPFQVIADPSRRAMLLLLSGENMTINALAGNFEISRPAVSKHVKALHEAGFITILEQGRERFCMLNPDGFDEIRDWLSYYDRFWATKLKNLEKVMNRNHGK